MAFEIRKSEITKDTVTLQLEPKLLKRGGSFTFSLTPGLGSVFNISILRGEKKSVWAASVVRREGELRATVTNPHNLSGRTAREILFLASEHIRGKDRDLAELVDAAHKHYNLIHG